MNAKMRESLYNTDLPIIELDRKELRKGYPLIDFGSEGKVYQYNEKTAFKIYSGFQTPIEQKMKFRKIECLGTIKEKNFCFPLGLVGFQNLKKEGSYMDLVEPLDAFGNFEYLKYLRDKKRILKIIKLADDAIRRVHSREIIIGDMRGANILIDRNDTPQFVDTDNYLIDEFYFDLVPARSTWLNRVTHESCSLKDNDIYVFAMMCLESILRIDVLSSKGKNPEYLYRYFRSIIDRLNVTATVKEGLRTIFSDARCKPYISSIFAEIDTDSELLSFNEEDKKYAI